MHFKVHVTAGLAILSLSGIAMAQQAAPASAPEITAQSHSAATQNGTVASGSGASLSNSPITNAAALGWQFVHATNCVSYSDGYLYVFPREGGYWFTNAPLFTTTMLAQCVHGNWIGFHVVTASTGAFDQIETFNYK